MKLNDISVLILTYNEQPNIERCLERLAWASNVVVIDSGSTDETVSICQRFANVRVVFRPFDSFASQCNFGLTQISAQWVLSIDADYLVPPDFVNQVEQADESADGYSCAFRYIVYGQPLRACLYPARTVLYRRINACYRDIGHGHRVEIAGPVVPLNVLFDHDDRKPFGRWLDSQRRYAVREAEHLNVADCRLLGFPDRVRQRIWLAAPAVLLYVLMWKRCIFDGLPGIYYAFQRAYAELLLSLELLDRKLGREESSVGSRQSKENRKATK